MKNEAVSTMKNQTANSMVLSGFFLALGLLMPFLTMQIPSIGSRLLPMHIPVLLCGFFCGWRYGLAVGLITPLFRSMNFGMPPMYPTAVAMAFELAAYGFLAGFLFKLFPKKNAYIFASLIMAMIFGRIIWGAASLLLYGLSGTAFTWQLFMAGAFVNAIPGIIVQVILIPMIVIAVKGVISIKNV